MLYSHLIEDLCKLILRDASFFHINDYKAPEPFPWKLEKIIDQLSFAFPDAGKLVEDMHRLRKIRNMLTHALLLQAGANFSTFEGRDQIHAMIERYVVHARNNHELLGKVFEAIVTTAIKDNSSRIFEREDKSLKDRVVSSSDIQRLLDELDG